MSMFKFVCIPHTHRYVHSGSGIIYIELITVDDDEDVVIIFLNYFYKRKGWRE